MCGFEQIPTILFSLETLLYMGLRMPAAQEIWGRWVSRDEEILLAGGNVVAFLNFFVDQVVELPSDPVHTIDEEWSVLLSDCERRLNIETIAAAYTIRGCWEFDMAYGLAIFPKHEWARVCCALDLVRRRYQWLLQIRETSLQREEHCTESPGRHGGHGGFLEHGNWAAVKASKTVEQIGMSRENETRLRLLIFEQGFYFWTDRGNRGGGHLCIHNRGWPSLWCSVMVSLNCVLCTN